MLTHDHGIRRGNQYIAHILPDRHLCGEIEIKTRVSILTENLVRKQFRADLSWQLMRVVKATCETQSCSELSNSQ